MNRKITAALVAVLMVLGLTACGGGGGGAAPPTAASPAGSSNWDSLVWDQDNWV